MELYFRTSKLQKLCNTGDKAKAKLGPQMARALQKRLMELKASDCLKDMEKSKMPQARCHELIGNRKGQISVDLKHPYRLIFIPSGNPVPRKQDGGLDWERITEVEIIDIVDTH